MARVYGGRWQTLRQVGRGGQSEVFLVEDLKREHQDPVVLKWLKNPKRRDRFQAEVEACKLLAHPGIITLIDHSALEADSDAERMYIVMPHKKAGDLEVRSQLYKGSLDSTLLVGVALCDALEHAHNAGVIHRDVKPANILFDDNTHRPILSDFGICLIRDEDRTTAADEVVGPRAFMAPELEGGGQLTVTRAADLYSVGKVLFFMLSGGKVLPRERHREKEFDLSGSDARYQLLWLLLDRLLCPVDRRVQAAGEVRAQLQSIQRWAQTATSTPVSSNALKALAAMATSDQNSIDDAQKYEEYRQQRETAVQSYVATVSDWLQPKAKAIAKALSVPGVVEATFVVAKDPEELFKAKRNTQGSIGQGALGIPGESDAQLNPIAAVGISVLRTADLFRDRVRSLYFVIATERRLRFGAPRVPKDPPEITAWLLPQVVDLRFVSGYINRRKPSNTGRGRRDTGHGFRSGEFRGEQFSVSLRTSISRWPLDLEAYERTIQEAVDLFLEHLAETAKGNSEYG